MNQKVSKSQSLKVSKSRIFREGGQKPSIAIVGYGKVGRVLARGFHSAGYGNLRIVARRSISDKWLKDSGISVSKSVADLPADVGFVVLALHNREISKVTAEIVARGGFRTGTVIAHTAGASSAEILEIVRSVGCLPLAWHPMQTFTGDESTDLLAGITFGIDGDPKAVRVGERLARELGGIPFRVPPEMRPAYHLSAVIASNLMAALVSVGQDLLQETGMDDARSLQALAPLIRATARSIARKGLPDAITGPLKRGDTRTIAAHLKVLDSRPEARAIYVVLSRAVLKRLGEVKNRRKMESLLR